MNNNHILEKLIQKEVLKENKKLAVFPLASVARKFGVKVAVGASKYGPQSSLKVFVHEKPQYRVISFRAGKAGSHKPVHTYNVAIPWMLYCFEWHPGLNSPWYLTDVAATPTDVLKPNADLHSKVIAWPTISSNNNCLGNGFVRHFINFEEAVFSTVEQFWSTEFNLDSPYMSKMLWNVGAEYAGMSMMLFQDYYMYGNQWATGFDCAYSGLAECTPAEVCNTVNYWPESERRTMWHGGIMPARDMKYSTMQTLNSVFPSRYALHEKLQYSMKGYKLRSIEHLRINS